MSDKSSWDDLAEVSSLKGEIRRRKDSYLYEAISKVRLKEYEGNGWELSTEREKTCTIKKKKVSDKIFEDRVWALFAKLRFESINKDSNFRIRYSDEKDIPGKQIDVYAEDNETVLLVECKSTEEPRKK